MAGIIIPVEWAFNLYSHKLIPLNDMTFKPLAASSIAISFLFFPFYVSIIYYRFCIISTF